MQAPPPVMKLYDSMDADASFRSIAIMIHNMPPAGVAQKLHEILFPIVTAMVGNNAYDSYVIIPSLCALSTQTQMQMCANPFLARHHVMLEANAHNADSYVASEASTNSNKSSYSFLLSLPFLLRLLGDSLPVLARVVARHHLCMYM